MSFWKLFRECIKEARQTKRDLRQIRNIDNSIDAFQRIVNTIALGGNEIEVIVELANGGKITIHRQPLAETGFETFQERARRAQQSRA